MSFTQFSMVEELASLIRDNLRCKHLVLSVEETLVTWLQNDTSSDGMLELEPMDPYSRLLIHRLADIFGFSHQSVGEGDDRHIVLQRCPDTSIPSLLVSDLLWEHDEMQYERYSDVAAKLSEKFSGLNSERRLVEFSLEDRQAAYMAARERIYSVDEYNVGEIVRQRPPKNPVVARRMIAHALGRQAKPSSGEVFLRDFELEPSASNGKILDEKGKASTLGTESCLERHTVPEKHVNSSLKQKVRDSSEASSSGMRTPLQKAVKTSKPGLSKTERSDYDVQKDKNEQVGAARRIFANALGFQPRNGNAARSSLKKETIE